MNRIAMRVLKTGGKPMLAVSLLGFSLSLSSCKEKVSKSSSSNVNGGEGAAGAENKEPGLDPSIGRKLAAAAVMKAKQLHSGLQKFTFSNGGRLPGLQGGSETANTYLRDLFETKAFSLEEPFYVEGVQGARKPDGNTEGTEALAAGENVWGFAAGVSPMRDAPATVALVTPLVKSTDGKWGLDIKAFAGNVVFAKVDGSVVTHQATFKDGAFYDQDGKLIFKDGEAYFETSEGEQKKVKIAMPEL